jgi:hypothetical protein
MLVSYLGTYDDGIIKLSEKPKGISHARVIITLILEGEVDESQVAMKLSEAAFDEWDNDSDSIYDAF